MAKTSRGPKEKPKDQKRTLLFLWSYLYQFKWLLLVALLLTIISNFFALLGPLLSGYAINAIEKGQGQVDFQKVFYYVGLMLVFFVLSSILSYGISILMIRLSQKIVKMLRKDVFHKITQLPAGYFDTHPAGDIMSRMTYDIDNMNTSLASDSVQMLTSVITIVGSFLMMLDLSVTLLMVFFVTVPLSILLTRFLVKKFQPLFSKRSKKLGELNGMVEEFTSGHQTIKAYHQEEDVLKTFQLKNKETVDAYYEAEYYGGMTGPSVGFINNLSLSFVSILGALLYLKNQMTIGSLSSFVLYSRKFSGPINEFANIFTDLQSTLAAAERVYLFLQEENEVADVKEATVLTNVKGQVDFENVTFGYLKDQPIIKNLQLAVKPGELIAIVGPTGAGKTTLVNLLMRFYDPDEGVILLDQQDIKGVTRSSLRKAYAMVLQETWLFKGTVFENLTYGNVNVTLDEVREVAKICAMDDYIMHLPKKYQTIIEEDGGKLSQGQKQLLTIARALLLKADLLILDEATSNVDTQTERKIQQAMAKLMENKTSFVIAHRLSTIVHADKILVVENGNIVEQGKHEELLLKNGVYAHLYQAQFEG